MTTEPVETDLDPSHAISGRMYLGTLDDSVTRYPWDGSHADVQSLSATLIYHALLGPRLCCRIGNLLYHPVYLQACLGESPSPLLDLCRTGFFQIHMREESINQTIESRLDDGTNSTLAFREHHDWRRGSRIYQQLDELHGRLTEVGRRKYNAQFHSAFQMFVDRAAPTASPAFGKVYERWNARFSGRQRTRSNFELLCLELFPQASDRESRRAAMTVVNSANHYGYGVGMAQLWKETNERPFVDTRELAALNNITRSVLGDDERKLSYERLHELAVTRAFDIVQKNLVVPLALFYSPEMWAKFAPLLDIQGGTRASREYRDLKLLVLLRIKRLLESDNVEFDKQRLRDSCREFSHFIRAAIGDGTAGTVGINAELSLPKRVAAAVGQTLSSEALSAVAREVVPGVPGKAVELAANVVVSVFAGDVGNPIRRKIDEAYARPTSSRDFYDQNLGPFLNTLSIKQIDINAAEKLGLVPPSADQKAPPSAMPER